MQEQQRPMLNSMTLALLSLVCLVGFGLRLQYINRSMRFDEALSVIEYGLVSLPVTLVSYQVPNNHVFHSVLLNLSVNSFGIHPMFVRLPVLIAGMLLIAVTFRVGQRFYNSAVGLVASALVAISPILIDYSVSARGYQIHVLLTMVLIWLGHQLKNRDSTGRWLLYGVLAAFSFFTVPTTLYSMGGIAIWLGLSIWVENSNQPEKRLKLLQNWFVAHALGAILTLLFYTPIIMFMGLDRLINNDTIAPLSPAEFYGQYDMLWVDMGRLVTFAYHPITLILALVCMSFALVRHGRLSQNRVSLMIPTLLWILAVTLIQRVFPFPRVWLFLAPLVSMWIAAGIFGLVQALRPSIAQRSLIAIAVVCLVLGGAFAVDNEVIHLSPAIGIAENTEEGLFWLQDNLDEGTKLSMSWPTNYAFLYYQMLHDIDLPASNASIENFTEAIIFWHHDWELAQIGTFIPIGERTPIQTFDYGTIERVTLDHD